MRPNPSEVVISITDTGPGIKRSLLEKISSSATRLKEEGAEGHGLRLWHAKRIVKKYKGTLR